MKFVIRRVNTNILRRSRVNSDLEVRELKRVSKIYIWLDNDESDPLESNRMGRGADRLDDFYLRVHRI